MREATRREAWRHDNREWHAATFRPFDRFARLEPNLKGETPRGGDSRAGSKIRAATYLRHDSSHAGWNASSFVLRRARAAPPDDPLRKTSRRRRVRLARGGTGRTRAGRSGRERKKNSAHARKKENSRLSGTLDDADVRACTRTYVDLCMAYNGRHTTVRFTGFNRVAHFTARADRIGGEWRRSSDDVGDNVDSGGKGTARERERDENRIPDVLPLRARNSAALATGAAPRGKRRTHRRRRPYRRAVTTSIMSGTAFARARASARVLPSAERPNVSDDDAASRTQQTHTRTRGTRARGIFSHVAPFLSPIAIGSRPWNSLCIRRRVSPSLASSRGRVDRKRIRGATIGVAQLGVAATRQWRCW